MGGGPQQTTQTSGTTTSEPWKDAQPALRYALNRGMQLSKKWGELTPAEKTAFGQMRGNAQFAQGYMPSQQDLISNLYSGGGLGEGSQDIRDAMAANRSVLTPYLSPGYLDPATNPYLQPAMEQARTGAYTDVADKFRAGGRTFSGAMADAVSRGMTNAALPMLLGQYNQNVGAQQNAAQQAMAASTQGAQALDQGQQARLQAMMAAPGQIQNLNVPQNMMLEAEMRRRNIPLDVLAKTTGMFTGMGALGSQGASTGYGMNQTYSNPWMTGIGAGIGVLGGLGSFF